MQIIKILAVSALGLAATPPGLSAQESGTDASGTFRDWSYFVVTDPKECLVVSAPTEWVATFEGAVVEAQRGDIRFYVSILPGDSGAGVPSFGAGYPLAPSSQVTVTVQDSAFTFLPNADVDRQFAWSRPEDDARVIAALKAGAEATVVGTSARGKVTTDTFSLLGFTAAYEKAQALCR